MIRNISVIIPARNEETNIEKILSGIFKRYGNQILEVIVVDDCSADKTPELIRLLQKKYLKIRYIRRESNPGVGRAVKEGLKNISPNSNYVLFMDCDFIVNLPDIGKFIKKINGFDAVIGSRFINKKSLKQYPLLKLIANRTYHWLGKILLGVNHSDLTNNFKLYSIGLVRKIDPYLTASDFSINAQIGFYPVLLKAKIIQIPVLWHERSKSMGLSKFKILKVGPSYARVFFDLILFRMRNQR